MEVFYVSCLVQTDATLLANNPQHCWMLHVASVCTPCCLLLHVVACCSAKFETVQNFEPTTPKISFVGSVCTALTTLLEPRTRITHGLQSLMGCILPTMHCRSQQCLELFAHHSPTLLQQLPILSGEQYWE